MTFAQPARPVRKARRQTALAWGVVAEAGLLAVLYHWISDPAAAKRLDFHLYPPVWAVIAASVVVLAAALPPLFRLHPPVAARWAPGVCAMVVTGLGTGVIAMGGLAVPQDSGNTAAVTAGLVVGSLGMLALGIHRVAPEAAKNY